MSDPKTLPAWGTEAKGLTWLAFEVKDHLWPWSRLGFRHQKGLQIASLAMASVVTGVWLLAANGQVRGNLVVAWWLVWSLMEVFVRLGAKAYVKEAPGGAATTAPPAPWTCCATSASRTCCWAPPCSSASSLSGC